MVKKEQNEVFSGFLFEIQSHLYGSRLSSRLETRENKWQVHEIMTGLEPVLMSLRQYFEFRSNVKYFDTLS